MKTLLLSLVLSFTTFALASAPNSLFSCREDAQLANPLNIQSLLMDVSNEDPVAQMKLLFKNSPKAIKVGMDYNGTEIEKELIPETSKVNLTIFLAKKKGQWTAKVTDDDTHAVSILSCDKDKMNVADFADEIKETALFDGSFAGELEDLGGACTVEMKKETNGDVTLQLKSGSLQLAVTLNSNVKVERKSQDEDSYIVEYKSDYKTIKIVDAEDAYKTISISNNSTKLTCAAYF